MEPINPYAPPMADLGDATRQLRGLDDLGRARRGRRIWLVLFALNLIVPGLLALIMLFPSGWLGVLGAVALLAGAGFAILVRYPRWIGVAVVGSIATASTQFVPMLQMMAGMLGLSVYAYLTGKPAQFVDDVPSPPLGLMGGFIVTLVTGTLLLVASTLGGLLLQGISRIWRRNRDPADAPDWTRL